MKTKTAKVLPKMASEIANGGLYLQRVRCGKQYADARAANCILLFTFLRVAQES